VVSKVWPLLAVADCNGAVVRTMMTVPAGKTTRFCADAAGAVDAATNASARLEIAAREMLGRIRYMLTS
jgi:hypothetical protein